MTLYNTRLDRDNCGFGLIAHLEGEASHKLVRESIHSLARMSHRGAVGADGKTGDGCGLLLQKPDAFFRDVARKAGWQLASRYGVGMLFLSREPDLQEAAREQIEAELAKETLTVAGWRRVPVDPDVLGRHCEKKPSCDLSGADQRAVWLGSKRP